MSKNKIINEIILSIDCYQCGTKLKFPFRMQLSVAEYCYCPDCQEGIEVKFDGQVFTINRLDSLAHA